MTKVALPIAKLNMKRMNVLSKIHTSMTALALIALLIVIDVSGVQPARAEALMVRRQLPVKLAAEATMAAISACRESGYSVTVTIVDMDGVRQFVARGNGAPPHTLENSFMKAYGIITMGAIYKRETTSDVGALLQSKSPGVSPTLAPGISLNAGGVAITAGDEMIAGIGVSGAPGGQFDETCAKAGVKQIQSHLLR
jgi:uncharacterized protein GlcG (DUF336 family)